MAPMLCSTFKGIMPSDLLERYNCEGGRDKLQYDVLVAAEISERINEQHEEAQGKRDAKKSVAKRNKKREERMTGKQLGQVLSDTFGSSDNTGE